MDEKDLKSMIENILADMTEDKKSDTTAIADANPVKSAPTNGSTVTDDVLEDITKIDLKKQFLQDNPHDRNGYLKIKSFTPARLGMGRVGTRYKTASVLRFRADHAAAQDAVFSDVDPQLPKDMGFLETQTTCTSKDEFLTRPDYGRKFSDETADKIKQSVTPNPKIQMVVGDGLSSAAIEANVKEIIPAIQQGLKVYGLSFETKDVIFVKYARVGAEDQIGELTGADVVCMLVGERPGLVTANSMSAYIAYKPTIGMPEANRTVVSNIHDGGLPAVEAGAYIAELLDKMVRLKKSGIDLKTAENAGA
ncbi:ethanolamine ammonia-lyase subunit EutC [Levilactobacillus brevis]|uniref:Ethanolamine ammonia-lyase small subunit n=2 Tax=Levilactobacillus brevis TaxID=1580 RepID=U2R5U4_LEVBR|nr:ethanolamine ammonia-lyase subunit EutC [Levilactobacillus brevis]ERK46042.1 ethanolamine ammonia-lyase, light subunit [Levilactobacillus brevis ATCC 14869 = DSM 20054]KIO99191.1 Ethanolamine ammonia-lyase light chain [Levilactobacillus brevis]KRK21284.1 ethanolamine ammonia-lyase small subunit [Levilactobacillus brevis ATCC 14869 = DSM 20054]MCT3571793.1 ethanolamine ammonia-lyase subunit EutC [Levilactobacillus brevis]PBQ24602.1 ethanolamine ammonia-lyase subunit EutC [Levilactobacillus b